MIKYFFWLPLSLLVSIAAKAELPFSPNSSSFSGFYAGISGGVSSTTSTKNIAANGIVAFSGVIENSFLNTNNTLIENAAKGALFLGYGLTWQRLYLGAELFGDISHYDVNSPERGDFIDPFANNILKTTTKIKLNPFEYGVDFRPGLLITPNTLLYGRVGAAINKLSLKTDASMTYENLTFGTLLESFSVSENSSAKVTRPALRLGAGIEERINQFAIQMDYTETNYGKLNTNGAANALVQSDILGPIDIHVNNNAHVKVINNTVMLGLSYYFSPQTNNIFDLRPNIFGNNLDKPFNGFYAGLEGGGSFTTATGELLAQTILALRPDFLTFSSPSDLKKNSPKGAIYGGYGDSWNYFYLGSEVFADYSNYTMKSSGSRSFSLFLSPPLQQIEVFPTTLNVTTRLNPVEYGIDLRPGLLFKSNTLLFGRIGVAVNKLTLNSDATSTLEFFDPVEKFDLFLPVKASKTCGALRLGVGIEQALSHSLSVRADYIHTDYGRISINKITSINIDSENLGPEVHELVNRVNTHVTNNTAMLGVTYYISRIR